MPVGRNVAALSVPNANATRTEYLPARTSLTFRGSLRHGDAVITTSKGR